MVYCIHPSHAAQTFSLSSCMQVLGWCCSLWWNWRGVKSSRWTVCTHLVLLWASICQLCSYRMTDGGHHCSPNVCYRGCWVSQVQWRSRARLSVKLESLACLTMSDLPTKFHSCRLILCSCAFEDVGLFNSQNAARTTRILFCCRWHKYGKLNFWWSIFFCQHVNTAFVLI